MLAKNDLTKLPGIIFNTNCANDTYHTPEVCKMSAQKLICLYGDVFVRQPLQLSEQPYNQVLELLLLSDTEKCVFFVVINN